MILNQNDVRATHIDYKNGQAWVAIPAPSEPTKGTILVQDVPCKIYNVTNPRDLEVRWQVDPLFNDEVERLALTYFRQLR